MSTTHRPRAWMALPHQNRTKQCWFTLTTFYDTAVTQYCRPQWKSFKFPHKWLRFPHIPARENQTNWPNCAFQVCTRIDSLSASLCATTHQLAYKKSPYIEKIILQNIIKFMRMAKNKWLSSSKDFPLHYCCTHSLRFVKIVSRLLALSTEKKQQHDSIEELKSLKSLLELDS